MDLEEFTIAVLCLIDEMLGECAPSGLGPGAPERAGPDPG